MLAQGQAIGKYRVLDLIGRGGFGSVYLAEDTWLKARVALKVPHQQEVDSDRLLREPRLLRTLDHPNIVRILTCEKIDRLFFLVMEYVEGRSMEAMLEEGGPLDLEPFHRFVDQICRAVDYAHRHNILHRDLRPANLLVTKDGIVKITDFGIARLLDRRAFAHTRIGSPPYMAPEHFAGRAVFASDIYSLGVTMYEMLTATLPYYEMGSGARPTEEAPPPHLRRPDLPRRVSDVVMKAMATGIEDRYRSGMAILEALDPTEPQLAPLQDTESMEDIKKRLHIRVETPATFCWNCRRPLSKKASLCPHCGEGQ